MPVQTVRKRKSPLIGRLAKAAPAIRSQFGVKRIGIFGSFARGEQTAASDVDVLVEFAEGYATFRNFMGLCQYLESLFHRKVDLLVESSLSNLLRPYIEQDVIWIER